MTIIDLHCEFTEALGKLLVYAAGQGLKIRLGPHGSGLGMDLLVYEEGKLQQNKISYRYLARYWKTLSPVARWGGDGPVVSQLYFYFTLPPRLED